VPPAVNQCSMSIGNHDDVTLQFCKKMNITYQAYSPFHGSVDIFHDPDIVAIAAKYKVSSAQVVLRWIVQNNAIFVTAGMNQQYLKQDLAIFDFNLNETEMGLLQNK